MKVAWPQDARVHVDWLSLDEARRMTAAAEGIERLILHLELGMGLRQCEVLRLKVKDVQMGYLDVLGKGKQGGKPRTVRFHPDSVAEFNYYFKLRGSIETLAKAKCQERPIPEELAIYQYPNGHIYTYGPTALDNIIHRVAERAKIWAHRYLEPYVEKNMCEIDVSCRRETSNDRIDPRAREHRANDTICGPELGRSRRGNEIIGPVPMFPKSGTSGTEPGHEVGPKRFGLLTSRLSAGRSTRLSYGPLWDTGILLTVLKLSMHGHTPEEPAHHWGQNNIWII